MRQGSLLLCMAVSPRGRGVSPRIAGSAPGLQVLLRGCRFSPSAADSAPGPRVLLRGCRFYSGAADSYLYNGRRSLHGALPEGEAYGPFSNRTHGSFAGEGRTGHLQTGCTGPTGGEGRTGPLPGWLTVRKAPKGRGGRHSLRGAKEKSVFTRKIRYFFLFLHQLGK